ncbi:hypothetical protein [Bavariicoccus seileri]|uniref:hypothetical protein n=1 Tax=Bavariicoccus seileri TaxID=549685 RepID=UPI003F935712
MGRKGKGSLSVKQFLCVFSCLFIGFMFLKTGINLLNRDNNHFLQTAVNQMYDGNAMMVRVTASKVIDYPLSKYDLLNEAMIFSKGKNDISQVWLTNVDNYLPFETDCEGKSSLKYVLVTVYKDQIEVREDYHLKEMVTPASSSVYHVSSTGTLDKKYNILTYHVNSDIDLTLHDLIAYAEGFGDMVTFEGQQQRFTSQLLIHSNGKSYRYRTDRPSNITRIVRLNKSTI